ncbi:MAG: flagellar hook-length control protein FliK [Treponema sp.]|nr:flagellar hook-length control protein FliK [Treponema sp.]
MQTLNVQFASANTASEKSTANKKSQKSSASFESVLKSVSESGKAKKAELSQAEENSSVKKTRDCPEGRKVSKKDASKKTTSENSESNKAVQPKTQDSPSCSNAENSFAQSGAVSSNAEKMPSEESFADENAIEVVFDLTAAESMDAESASLAAGTAPENAGIELPLAGQKDEALDEFAAAAQEISSEGGEKALDAEIASAGGQEGKEALLSANDASATANAEQASANALKDSSKKLSAEKQESKSSKDVKPLAEAKSSNSVFTIVDQRTAVEANREENLELKEDSLNAVSASSDEVQAFSGDAARIQSQQNILSSNNQSAGANGSTFQAMLSQQIQENAPEFVKAGSIILRDNDSGTINMTMKPESLGNVKIRLEVSDKVIAGQITVHSQEAYDAFKQNLDTLKQAFQQNGFDSAGFTLNLAQNGNSGSFGQEQHQMAQEFMSNRTYGELASSGESSVQETESSAAYSKSSGYQIDVVA